MLQQKQLPTRSTSCPSIATRFASCSTRINSLHGRTHARYRAASLVNTCRAATAVHSSSNNEHITSSSLSNVSVAVSSPETGSTSSTAVAAAAASSGGSTAPAGKEALLARIAAAKAYKQQAGAGATSSSGSSNTPASAAAPSSSGAGAGDGGGEEGALTEEQQEAMRQQYLEQLRQQQAELAAQSSNYNSFLQQQQQQQSGQSPLDRLQQEDRSPGQRPAPARPDFYTNPDVPEVQQLLSNAPKKAGTGSADEAAEWLKGVLADKPGQPAIGANMRLEEYTAAKEAAMKQRGAEIITAFPEDFTPSTTSSSSTAEGSSSEASQTAAADSNKEEDGEKYKPKVTTWGVFPRPQNISQAYGGGRNIRPGQELETAEQRAKREADYAAALARYKKATHTDTLSDAELAAAQATFNDGMALFKRGLLQEALQKFDEVRNKVPLKSKLGGMSTLQAAVCYDTLGNARQAEALYKRIQGHPTTEVSRKAKQLVFGFQAMTFLKTEGLSYAVKKEDYLKYFRRAADRNRMYVASEEERAADQAEAAKAAVLALGVVLGPVVIMGALLAGSKMG